MTPIGQCVIEARSRGKDGVSAIEEAASGTDPRYSAVFREERGEDIGVIAAEQVMNTLMAPMVKRIDGLYR